MILFPVGTKVWYTTMSGDKIPCEVLALSDYRGSQVMEVLLPGDPGRTIAFPARLSPRDEDEDK